MILRLEPIGPIQRGYVNNVFQGLFDRQGTPVENSFALAQASDIATADLVALNPLLAADIAAGGSTDVIAGDPTGVIDITAAFNAAVAPGGTYVLAGKTNARLEQGTFKAGFLTLHPSESLEMHSRGGTVLAPIDNLPATDPVSGLQASLITISRVSPDISSTLAWAPRLSGFNLDARGTTQINPVNGLYTPNPKNAPGYSGNKDYVAGAIAYMDIVGFSGHGWSVEAGNGRADVFSARALNNALNGFDFGSNNDIVMSGHWAVGGNGQFGLKVGLAAGFFAVTGNLWGQSNNRSLTCGAEWISGRKMFAQGYCEFNDWLRVDGGQSYWRGGVLSNLVFAQFGANFVSDGVAIDNTPGGDSRLSANVGTVEYQSLNFYGNSHLRSDSVGNAGVFTVTIGASAVFTCNAHGLANNTPVVLVTSGALPTGLTPMTWYYVVNKTTNTFQLSLTVGGAAITTSGTQSGVHGFGDTVTASNVGGNLVGAFGTAPAYLHDIGGAGAQPAMVNIFEGYCSAPNVKGWTGPSTTFTVTIASPGVFTTPVAHGLQVGYRLAFATTGALPTGLAMGVQYFVVAQTSTTFQVSATLGGAAINTSGTQSGAHRVFNLSAGPYNTHNNAQTNYAYQDAYLSLFRVGAQGPVHSHVCLATNESDEPNPSYYFEAGDRVLASRTALYGATELQQAVQYQAAAFDGRTLTTGQTRVIKAGQTVQRITIGGGGIATATVNLPTDMLASQFLDVFFLNGAITALTWALTGAGSFSGNSPVPPTFTQGFTHAQFWYDHTVNTWYMLSLEAGDQAGTLGRVDGSAAQAGIVGEGAQSSIIQGSAVALTTATVANITSLALTPGNYRINWTVKFRGVTAATITNMAAGVNIVSATLVLTKAEQAQERVTNFVAVTGTVDSFSGGDYALRVTAATTVYLSAAATFSAGTMSAFGVLTAQRVS